ncbi:flavodoxin family protein [Bacillus mesophilum]|uniref:Flavodoxin family protein n=1 Tax=Bacillus mesophilum TaxID=1071718 RepID=A0A7V7RHI8_9BACI|nr:flavodoxin family protein [Bacillus mesophilum]KAB2328911.1 flavodoxin family protein [Bacillus mesophilum]
MKIVSIVGSTRKGGNTEQLTDLILKGIEHQKIYASDLHIKPIEDLRHSECGFQTVNDDYHKVINALLTSDIVIFGTPIYWYSMTGTMKNIFDRLSHAIRDKRYPHLKEHLKKLQAIAVIVGGDDPRIKGIPLIQQFQYTFEFLNMPFPAYIIGEANKPGEILKDSRALTEASWLNDFLKSK